MLTEEEKILLEMTSILWNALTDLPAQHSDDLVEARRDIHNIQNRILARVACRELDNAKP